MRKEYSNEIFWLRAFSCLSVVLIHSITSNRLHHPNTENAVALELLLITLLFSTPAFVFISEFLFARAYPNGLPEGFFKKRTKLILMPYISMGIIFAIVFNDNLTLTTIIFKAATNIFLGTFVAYFILIIFQFYILHHLFYKKLKKWNPRKVLFWTFIVNVVYLGFFNFTTYPDALWAEYLWKRGHWLLAIGWIFYFALGYYTGTYYSKFKVFITKHPLAIFVFFLLNLGLITTMHVSGVLDITSSKRIDMLLYTTSVIFLVMWLSSVVRTIPKIILLVSNYSFNIYLLHRFTVSTLGPVSNNDILNVAALFVIGVSSSIAMAFVINQIPFGKYIVGKPYQLKKTKSEQREEVKALNV